MLADLKSEYEKRIDQFNERRSELLKDLSRLSYWRLAIFLASVVLLILVYDSYGPPSLLLILPIIGVFGVIVKKYDAFNKAVLLQDRLIKTQQLELRSLDNDDSWNFTGDEYLQSGHPCAADLDLFGEHSLYQHVNRAKTIMGRSLLAGWLQKGTSQFEILARQEACNELKPLLDLRHELIAHSADLKDDQDSLNYLQTWLSSEDFFSSRKSLKILRWILPFLTIALIFLANKYLGYLNAWLPLIIPGIIMHRSNKMVTAINNLTEKAIRNLKTYSEILRIIESSNFQAPMLQEIKSAVEQPGMIASKEIRTLAYRINQLSIRQNFFGILFNLFTMWDFHWMVALEKSKSRLIPVFDQWLNAIAQIESLSSLANFGYNHTESSVPSIGKETIHAMDLGHPLIPIKERVNNNIHLNQNGHIWLVTGSNMAGKSTFLRTVGANLILANAGGLVCATKFQFDPCPVYTSMRVSDNLEQGASSFYAELRKLKEVIDALHKEERIVFLLDEILKGTNSADRHKGSAALLRQLLKNKGVGIVATHDLALTELEKEYPAQLENWYFDVVIHNDQLAFDYRIKKGICQSFNASILMKKMGIEM